MASDGITLFQITHVLVHNHPPAGYVHRVRVILTPTYAGYHYDLQGLLVSVDNGVITSDEEFTQVCKRLLQSNGFVFCPGISYDKYNDEYLLVVRFHCKQVNMSVAPLQRDDSIGCLRWYKLPKNATFMEQASSEVLCSSCIQLLRILENHKKRSAQVSRGKKFDARQQMLIIPPNTYHQQVLQQGKEMHRWREQRTNSHRLNTLN